MLASCLRFLRRNALRIGVVLGTFALVASFIFVQQMREACAEQAYQSARTQVLKAQARAAQLGLDTAEYPGLPVKAQDDVNNATTVRAFRAVNSELKAPLSKLSLIVADQETANKLVGEYAAQAAAKDHGDAGLARAGANAALAQVRADL